MSERRLFTVNAPDWGQTHLTSDAVVAFVDDELAQRPHARASAHVAICPDCAAEVVAQRQARTALRGASCPSLPSSLLMSLRSIPQDTELPGPPAGLAVTDEGQL
ncbi:zf-HC2 domain-containing protein, partial [Pseudonocardia oceani]